MLSAISRTFSSGNYFASRTHYNSTRLLTLVLPSCLRKQSEEIETTFSTIITSLEDMFQLPANKLIASIKYLTDSELEKDILDKLVSNSPLEPYFGQLADAISHLTVAT